MAWRLSWGLSDGARGVSIQKARESKMALKNLTVEEMVPVTAAWLAEGDAGHRALQAQAVLSGLLGDIGRVHEGLLRVVPEAADPRKSELSQLAAEEDRLHDILARGIHGILTHLALLEDDGSDLIALRDQLMPGGLGKTIRATYRGQAGWTRLLRSQLTAEAREKLAEIPLRGDRNLLTTVTSWLEAGDRLGELEKERGRLEEGETKSFGQQVVEARNKWIRVVNALVGLAEPAELDGDTERVIFGPLRAAEEKADQRAARRSSDNIAQEPVGRRLSQRRGSAQRPAIHPRGGVEGSSVGNTTNELCRRLAGTSRGSSARRGVSASPSVCNGLLGGAVGPPSASDVSGDQL